MKREKKQRLEREGWRVSTVSEFLGLTDEEAALIELKLDLARAVKTERVRRHLTQEELGRALGSSQSRVAKMEAGDPTVSIDLLVRSLLRLGVNRRDLARHLNPSTSKRAAEPLSGLRCQEGRRRHCGGGGAGRETKSETS
jgi:transcriptional regulator with XRE-family HTH domain